MVIFINICSCIFLFSFGTFFLILIIILILIANLQIIKCNVLLPFIVYLKSPTYLTGTPEAGSGPRFIVLYDPNNQAIRRYLRFSYHLFGGD